MFTERAENNRTNPVMGADDWLGGDGQGDGKGAKRKGGRGGSAQDMHWQGGLVYDV